MKSLHLHLIKGNKKLEARIFPSDFEMKGNIAVQKSRDNWRKEYEEKNGFLVETQYKGKNMRQSIIFDENDIREIWYANGEGVMYHYKQNKGENTCCTKITYHEDIKEVSCLYGGKE